MKGHLFAGFLLVLAVLSGCRRGAELALPDDKVVEVAGCSVLVISSAPEGALLQYSCDPGVPVSETVSVELREGDCLILAREMYCVSRIVAGAAFWEHSRHSQCDGCPWVKVP